MEGFLLELLQQFYKDKTALEKGTKKLPKSSESYGFFPKINRNGKVCEVDMKFAKDFKDYLLNEKTIKGENTDKPKVIKG